MIKRYSFEKKAKTEKTSTLHKKKLKQNTIAKNKNKDDSSIFLNLRFNYCLKYMSWSN